MHRIVQAWLTGRGLLLGATEDNWFNVKCWVCRLHSSVSWRTAPRMEHSHWPMFLIYFYPVFRIFVFCNFCNCVIVQVCGSLRVAYSNKSIKQYNIYRLNVSSSLCRSNGIRTCIDSFSFCDNWWQGVSLHVIFTPSGFVTLCKQIVTMSIDVIHCQNYTLCNNELLWHSI